MTGIFQKWEECQKQIAGFKAAEFKGFETEDEAKAYLEETGENVIDREEEEGNATVTTSNNKPTAQSVRER